VSATILSSETGKAMSTRKDFLFCPLGEIRRDQDDEDFYAPVMFSPCE
jgi:hypothetical protein